MALEHIHENIGYRFFDIRLLSSAFKPAHRNDEEKIHDDGNRGLAALGMKVIEVVTTQNIVVVEQGTKKDVDSHVHWTRSKRGRAHACEVLGLDHYVDPSIRQQFERPPTTVLAYVLSAVLGAAWLDMQRQNKSMPNTIEIMSQILRRIDAVVVERTMNYSASDQGNFELDSERNISAEITVPTEELDSTASAADRSNCLSITPAVQESLYGQNDALNDLWSTPLDINPQMVSDFTWLDIDQGYDLDLDMEVINLDMLGRISDRAIIQESQGEYEAPGQGRQTMADWSMATDGVSYDWTEYRRMAVTPAKRKHSHDQGRAHHSITLQEKLAHEEAKTNNLPEHLRNELRQFLDHHQIAELGRGPSQVSHLRFLYFIIGSCQSLLTFKDTLRLARESPCLIHVPRTSMSAEERIQTICRLNETEALCVILRRCHTVKLFETQREFLREKEAMTLNTVLTFNPEQRVKRGNPGANFEASLTEAMLSQWMPGLEEGTKEYDKLRAQVTHLRRLAKILGSFTNAFGFGIIALLPSAPSSSELHLSDTTLAAIGEQRLQKFVRILSEYQGPFLERLSRAVEPALMALINGTLPSTDLHPIEHAEPSAIERLPKGYHEIFEHLA